MVCVLSSRRKSRFVVRLHFWNFFADSGLDHMTFSRLYPIFLCNIMLTKKLGGCSPKKNQKKPVATPKLANWHWFFLVFFGYFWFFKISKLALVFFWFFLVFFGFFWHWFWPEFEIGNWFFFGFFWVFLVFLVFFGLSFGQHSKLETGFWVFLVFFGFFWDFLVFFGI